MRSPLFCRIIPQKRKKEKGLHIYTVKNKTKSSENNEKSKKKCKKMLFCGDFREKRKGKAGWESSFAKGFGGQDWQNRQVSVGHP